MGNWSGAEMRCPKCNKYMPDRCICNGPSIEERRAAPSSSASEDNPYAAPTWDHEMAPNELEGEASADELPGAVIAGIMGWRGPGAYTAATLRKIREVIAADRRARQGEGSVINYGSPTKINMAQSGVGDYGRGYCAGWNDCVDDFSRAAIQAAAPADALAGAKQEGK